MRPSEIAGCVNGFSIPIIGGGLSWNPPTVDRDVARKVLAFLEDRRVLYEPSEVEMAEHCIESVIQIRRFSVCQHEVRHLLVPLPHRRHRTRWGSE